MIGCMAQIYFNNGEVARLFLGDFRQSVFRICKEYKENHHHIHMKCCIFAVLL